MDYPLISVCIITYNHEEFIMDCLEGVFRQDYPNIEVIISNDCSVDKTHQIISDFISNNRREGIVFRYYNQEKNLGVSKNFLESLKNCKGQFIAICEGDDFWFNDSYLSNHFSFLSQAKDYSFSLSRVTFLDQDSKQKIEVIRSIKIPPVGRDINFPMIALGYHIGIQSMMFKSTIELFNRLDGYTYFFDTALVVELLNLGKGKALDSGGSMYRIQESGFMSGSNPFFRIRFNFLLFFEIVNKNKSIVSLQRRSLFLASEYYMSILKTAQYSYIKEFLLVSFTSFVTFGFSWKVIKLVLFNTFLNFKQKTRPQLS